MHRRAFLARMAALTGAAAVAPHLLWEHSAAGLAVAGTSPYGPLQAPDGNGLQLPVGFTSRRIATTGQPVGSTGYAWHGSPDGGGCFALGDGGWVYVSNSEVAAAAGGTSAVQFDAYGEISSAYRVLTGTSMNCAGGATPWGTWLSCEENGSSGKVYECDPRTPGQGIRRPLLGSFSHEAAAVDPVTGNVYLTEDHPSGRLYRFVPTTPGDLTAGTLQAAAMSGSALAWLPVGTTAPERSARTTVFNGGEGAWISGRTLWFTTKGDGRVWEIDLGTQEIQVLFDDDLSGGSELHAVDNLTVHEPSGDLFVAEDGAAMELFLVSNDAGQDVVASFLRVIGHPLSEITGPAFSPDGTRLYFSSQRGVDGSHGITYEVTGPFRTAPLPPSATSLVAAGSWWRYLDDGSDLGTTWRVASFDDGAWAQGLAPLGYGDPMATKIGFGPSTTSRYITSYFRRTFTVTHGFTSVRLRLRSDDGAIVFVNGREVVRRNMPAGPATSNTLAASPVTGIDEKSYTSFDIAPLLYEGTNLIAVEVHQSGRASDDLGFDLSLDGTGDAGPLPAPPDPPTVVVPITTDAHVRNGPLASTQFGSASLLEVQRSATAGDTRVTYLSVDTSEVVGPIAMATLRLWGASTGAATILKLHPVVSTSWAEGTLTWASAPARGTPLTTFRLPAGGPAWREIDVTGHLATERQAGRFAVSFAITEQADGPLVELASSEAPEHRPELRLDR